MITQKKFWIVECDDKPCDEKLDMGDGGFTVFLTKAGAIDAIESSTEWQIRGKKVYCEFHRREE